jgi:hypothetical protein
VTSGDCRPACRVEIFAAGTELAQGSARAGGPFYAALGAESPLRARKLVFVRRPERMLKKEKLQVARNPPQIRRSVLSEIPAGEQSRGALS